jgi:hypothetical protein
MKMLELVPDAAAFEKRLAGLPVIKHPACHVVLGAGSKTGRLFFLRTALWRSSRMACRGSRRRRAAKGKFEI